MSEAGRPPTTTAGRRGQLAFAAGGVLLAATDTYVVVVALPSIMDGVGIGLDQLQRATPVISGFLLGYVAVLPLLGRLSDLVGRRPVFNWCLAAFAGGSVVTATAHSLGLLVAGRALQGLGGGGLVPVTLALVAERWPPERRGLPLGVVGAVQELGAVIGPLYGAVVVAVAGWRWIFWLNLPLSALVWAGFARSRPAEDRSRPAEDRNRPAEDCNRPAQARTALEQDQHERQTRARTRWGPRGLAAFGVVLGGLALDAPASLADGVTTGHLYAVVLHGSDWSVVTTPVALAALACLAAGLAWTVVAPPGGAFAHPPLRGALAEADLPGAVALAVFLGCIVIAFSTADPGTQVVGSDVAVLGPLGAVAAVAFALRQRRSRHPLLPPGALAARPAWGALVVNFLTGAALIAALVDVPLFARATTYPDSQTGAALVLLRFLVAVPVGAVLGGLAVRRATRAVGVAAGGLALAAAAFATMTSWSAGAITEDIHAVGLRLPFSPPDVALVLCGLGVGLAIAPVNASILAAVATRLHGLASGLAVVARTVGMLVGISVLTAVALHRFYRAEARIGSPLTLCPTHPGSCPVYDRATTAALLSELHAIFLGAAVAAGLAAVAAAVLLRPKAVRAG